MASLEPDCALADVAPPASFRVDQVATPSLLPSPIRPSGKAAESSLLAKKRCIGFVGWAAMPASFWFPDVSFTLSSAVNDQAGGVYLNDNRLRGRRTLVFTLVDAGQHPLTNAEATVRLADMIIERGKCRAQGVGSGKRVIRGFSLDKPTLQGGSA